MRFVKRRLGNRASRKQPVFCVDGSVCLSIHMFFSSSDMTGHSPRLYVFFPPSLTFSIIILTHHLCFVIFFVVVFPSCWRQSLKFRNCLFVCFLFVPLSWCVHHSSIFMTVSNQNAYCGIFADIFGQTFICCYAWICACQLSEMQK